jgi:pyruvyl transferase EpsO
MTPSRGGLDEPEQAPPATAADAGARLRDRYLDVLREHVPTDRPWLLVGASRKFNPGDTALALGTYAAADALGARFLRRLPGSHFRPQDVAPGTVVLVHGGGNFGGLYGGPHDLQVRVLTTLRDHPVVQLPQSVEFPDPARREEIRRAVGEHPDVLVLARDARSFDRGTAELDCPVALAPDAAFGLGPLPRPAPVEGVRVLSRQDKERAESGATVTDPRARDWPAPAAISARRAQRDGLELLDRLSGRPVLGPLADRASWRVWTALARSNFRVGRQETARGELLVTDRLHGHILACLAGVRHVVVNDGYGKIEAMWRTWTHTVPTARYAPTWEDARDALTGTA